jgi:hypothetical protein
VWANDYDWVKLQRLRRKCTTIASVSGRTTGESAAQPNRVLEHGELGAHPSAATGRKRRPLTTAVCISIVASFVQLATFAMPLIAQGLATPGAHWGAILLPDREHRLDLAFQAVLFTEFGKEVRPNGQYALVPYNDLRETLGFNVLSLSHTTSGATFPFTESSVQRRTSFAVGVVDDHLTEFLQNDLAHWAKIRGRNRLRRVPRRLGDTEATTSAGITLSTPILQLSQEFFFRPQELDRVGATLRQQPSSLFAGGGYTVGTINHEAFLHAGLDPIGFRPSEGAGCRWGLCLHGLEVGGMARAGLLVPSALLRDLTSSFASGQAVLRLEASIAGFPFSLEAALTDATGFFAEPRTQAESIEAAEREKPAASLYYQKRPKRERLVAHRLRMGQFTFEYLNDSVGNKDKGPTFGVSTGFNLARSSARACQVAGYFTVDGSSVVEVTSGTPKPSVFERIGTHLRGWWRQARCTL